MIAVNCNKATSKWPKMPFSSDVIVRCLTSTTIFGLLYATIRYLAEIFHDEIL